MHVQVLHFLEKFGLADANPDVRGNEDLRIEIKRTTLRTAGTRAQAPAHPPAV